MATEQKPRRFVRRREVAQDDTDSLLTTAQVREILQLSRAAVYRLVAIGELRIARLGPRKHRFSRREVSDFITRALEAST